MGYIVTFFFQMHEVRISNEGELYQNHRYNIYFMYFFDSACYWAGPNVGTFSPSLPLSFPFFLPLGDPLVYV